MRRFFCIFISALAHPGWKTCQSPLNTGMNGFINKKFEWGTSTHNKLSDDIKNHWTEIALSSGYGSIFIRNGTYYYNGTYIKYNHYNGAVFLIDSVGGLHIWRIVSGVHSMKSTNF